jgi:ADP-heptose:LPS heptosyltransferase
VYKTRHRVVWSGLVRFDRNPIFISLGFQFERLKFGKMGTPKAIKISVVIITFNEEKNIGRCIRSVKEIADEILIVDSFSKDATKAICTSMGARFVERRFTSHMDQKNFGLREAKYPYILSLDADEYLSERLLQSIKEVKQSWQYQAYRMNRLSNYGGKWIRHGNWYPDQKVRLWNREVGLWGGENPHEEVILKRGVAVKHLKGDIAHHATKDTADALSKIQQYSHIFAREYVGKKHSSVSRILFSSWFAFFKCYILKRGFLDGFEGLMVAITVANHAAYKYAKLLEANRLALLGKRVILSRTDNLGDVILTLPLAGYLKAAVPGIEIIFLGKKYTQPIVEKSVFVDRFLDCDELLAGRCQMSSIEADSILFVFPHRQLAKMAKQSNIPVRVATGHRWYNWLYCNKRVEFSRINSSLHESQLNFKLLRPFKLIYDIDLSTIESYYGIQPHNENYSNIISSEKFNLVIHPKSKGSAREWPLEKYLALVNTLPQDEFKIFITGLPEEGRIIQQECPELLVHRSVVNLIGQFNLSQLVSFINQVDGLLACSTGVLHLAAALGKFALGIYSPMRPIHPGRWKPIGRNADYLVFDKKCDACRYSTLCACVQSISVEEVARKLQEASAKIRITTKPSIE